MRTHPDIGLVIADLLQLARFWLCILPSQINNHLLKHGIIMQHDAVAFLGRWKCPNPVALFISDGSETEKQNELSKRNLTDVFFKYGILTYRYFFQFLINRFE